MRRKIIIILVSVLTFLSLGYYACWNACYYTVEKKEYHEPEEGELKLEDDKLVDKHPVFETGLIDSRPIRGWEVNLSAAIVKLDCRSLKPDEDTDMKLNFSTRVLEPPSSSSEQTMVVESVLEKQYNTRWRYITQIARGEPSL